MTAPATVKAPTTSGDVLALLRRHYIPEGRPPAGIFAPEIQCPAGQRRADLIWMPTGWSTGTGLVGHEIKVTRSDVLAELADPTKADAWARYCRRWWLVVADPALVDGLTVPEQWGIMAPPSGRRTRTMTVLRDAPRLTPIDTAAAYARIAAWTFNHERDAAASLRAENRRLTDDLERERERLRNRELAAAGVTSPHAQRVAGILTAVRALAAEEHVWGEAVDEDVVRAVVDAKHARAAAQDIARRVSIVAGTLNSLIRADALPDRLARLLDEAKDIQAAAGGDT